jgi:hypothetical protein
MANYRIPRGFETFRPSYLELCEGVRPNITSVPISPWTGLAPTRIDQKDHDPIVLEPGTIVGFATGYSTFSGKLFPACWSTGAVNSALAAATTTHAGEFKNYHHSDGATWGLPAASASGFIGVVKPIGIIYQPIYSFNLQRKFQNYQKNVNVGILTDYVIQIPCITAKEHLITDGDLVMVAHQAYDHGVFSNMTVTNAFTNSGLAGRFEKVDVTLTGYAEHVVGRCLKKTVFGLYSAGSAGDLLQDTLAAGGTITLSAEASAEWVDLAKIQTVPGMQLTGSGSQGIPGHLFGARLSANKYFAYMTILIRL